MFVSDFDFHLPPDLIAQEPLEGRSASRMLHLERSSGGLIDRKFKDFPALLRPGDLLVVNNSRVFPARLYGCRCGVRAQPLSSHNPASKLFLRGRVEVLLTRPVAPFEWQALVHPGRKIGVGEKLWFGDGPEGVGPKLEAEIIARGPFGERTLRFQPVDDFFALVERLGHVPLPPYIARPDRHEDLQRYQTVYAKAEATGSVAAPTAGLHFTQEMLSEIRRGGVEVAEVTLHVGLGTFRPVRVARVEDHRIHSEHFVVSPDAAARINHALDQGRRVVAVGTTTVRTLEFEAARHGNGRLQPGSGDANIFIYPGWEFRVVGALLTNFHLPRSTLLMLVSAFAGREKILGAYEHAVEQRYRFFSYGDCMFIE